MVERSHDLDLLQQCGRVDNILEYVLLTHRFESVLFSRVASPLANVYFCRVSISNQFLDNQLLLEFKQDDILLQGLDPLFGVLFRVRVELMLVVSGSQDEAIHVGPFSVLKACSLESTIGDVHHSTFLIVSFGLNLMRLAY